MYEKYIVRVSERERRVCQDVVKKLGPRLSKHLSGPFWEVQAADNLSNSGVRISRSGQTSQSRCMAAESCGVCAWPRRLRRILESQRPEQFR
jgi:hypothetical protein